MADYFEEARQAEMTTASTAQIDATTLAVTSAATLTKGSTLMAYPPGVSLATITIGAGRTMFGTPPKLISATVTPIFKGTPHVVHAESGWAFYPTPQTFRVENGEELNFELPHVNAEGWRDTAGNEFPALLESGERDKGWAYHVKFTVVGGSGQDSVPHRYEKVFQPLVGQTGPMDVDLIPDGQIGEPVSAPVSTVLSIAGLTGAVTEEQLSALGFGGASDPEIANLIQDETTATGTAFDTQAAAIALNPSTATGAALSGTFGRKVRLPDDPDFRQIPVVMMHNFASLGDAQGLLKDYKAWGYETIFFSKLVDYLRTGNAAGLPQKPLCITVDDGGLSNYQYLYPALQEFGMKATYFIVPAWINGDITTPPNGGTFMEASPFTWANAQEMVASGVVELQSHTLKHGSMRSLTGAGTFTADLSEDGTGAGADFLAAKDMIETNVPGANVQHSAAPYGVINEAAIESLRTAGCLGQRITATGRGADRVYDGSGPMAFTLPSTDPLRVPIASDGNFKAIRRANIYGEADADGNRIQNGRFLVTARGFTVPAGWSFVSTSLPSGAEPATGNVLRGYGTAAAAGAYHTDLIPVGYWGQFNIDYFVKATSVPTNGARLVLDCYDTIGGTLVKTLIPPQGQSSATGGAWMRKRVVTLGDETYQWVRPRFEVAGATSTSEMLVWDARLRVQRNALAAGSPRAIA